MTIKIIPPDIDRRPHFERWVQPLLIAAQENNAVDQWMFNLWDDGEINFGSVVYVSSQHLKVFIINNIEEHEPLPEGFLSDYQLREKIWKERDRELNVIQPDPVPHLVKVQEKWRATIEYWDTHNSRYYQTKSLIRSPHNTPSMETLCECINFDLWLKGELPDWFLGIEAHYWFVQKMKWKPDD